MKKKLSELAHEDVAAVRDGGWVSIEQADGTICDSVSHWVSQLIERFDQIDDSSEYGIPKMLNARLVSAMAAGLTTESSFLPKPENCARVLSALKCMDFELARESVYSLLLIPAPVTLRARTDP